MLANRNGSASGFQEAKKSLFNRPAWAKPATDTANNENLFHRSDQTYVKVAAEEERRRHERLAQKRQKGEKQSKTQVPVKNDDIQASHRKRRRLSLESDDDGAEGDMVDAQKGLKPASTAVDSSSEEEVEVNDRQAGGAGRQSSPKSLAKRYDILMTEKLSDMCETTIKAVDGRASRQTRSNKVINLDDDSGDEPTHKPATRHVSSSPRPTAVKVTELSTDDLLPSDDEFEDLARAVRERARRKRLQDDIAPSPQLRSPSVEEPFAIRSPSTHEPTPPPPDPMQDPVLQILITSRLASTTPLIVNRRTSQRLKDVRITWCNRQKFSSDMSSKVFLTWRGKRLFDVTTCKSLGIAANENGIVRFKGTEDMFCEDERQIHMEAMTDELFAEYKLEKQRKEDVEGKKEPAEDTGKKATQAKKKSTEPEVRIIVKAKDFAEFKLIVRPVCFSHS